MIVFRRLLLLLALLLWQGGFMFYAAVVVPVGSEVLGSHQAQGWIARSVAIYLNLAGLAALIVWVWDIATAVDPRNKRRRSRWALWVVLLLTLGLQFWLHPQLDGYLDLESFRILDQPSFYFLHRWYLNVSMVQWLGSLILMAASLSAWRATDGDIGPKPTGNWEH